MDYYGGELAESNVLVLYSNQRVVEVRSWNPQSSVSICIVYFPGELVCLRMVYAG